MFWKAQKRVDIFRSSPLVFHCDSFGLSTFMITEDSSLPTLFWASTALTAISLWVHIMNLLKSIQKKDILIDVQY